jgi:hypothetical protein
VTLQQLDVEQLASKRLFMSGQVPRSVESEFSLDAAPMPEPAMIPYRTFYMQYDSTKSVDLRFHESPICTSRSMHKA